MKIKIDLADNFIDVWNEEKEIWERYVKVGLEEEKKIPDKLGGYADISGDLAYEWNFAEKKLRDKTNEIIDYLHYIKSKGEQ